MERPDIARYVEYIESRPPCVQKTCLSSRGTVLRPARKYNGMLRASPSKSMFRVETPRTQDP